jgi:hypothetical protein
VHDRFGKGSPRIERVCNVIVRAFRAEPRFENAVDMLADCR